MMLIKRFRFWLGQVILGKDGRERLFMNGVNYVGEQFHRAHQLATHMEQCLAKRDGLPESQTAEPEKVVLH